jgi:hypothetical protein
MLAWIFFQGVESVLALCVQTPKVGDVPLGGIGSSALFLEDSGLGPEPVLPTRYGNGIDNKVLPAALFVLAWYLSLAPHVFLPKCAGMTISLSCFLCTCTVCSMWWIFTAMSG